MIVYVESNFILELALEQEQCQNCEEILEICELGKASLVIPSFCIAEPYQTLGRRVNEREKLRVSLNYELKLLARTKSYQEDINTLQNITSILLKSEEEENQRLYQVLNKILGKAELIPLEYTIITTAKELQSQFNLKPADAIVYTSILQHLLKIDSDQEKCFLNKDSDFSNPDIITQLETYNCKMLYRFDDGLNYIRHQTR